MKRNFIFMVLVLLFLNGCSAMMALNGGKEPNLSVITKGQAKSIVESEPLKPIKVEQLSNGNFLSTYQYTVGKEPSVGRAVIYVLLDSMTLFISELVTMPIEAGRKGTTKLITVEYTPNGEVVRVR